MKNKQPLTTYDAVKEKALRLLEFRSHSEHELAAKLRRAGASEEHTEQTLDFCRRYGFVDDREYARRKAADLIKLKRLGRRRVESELKSLGLDDELISDALSECGGDEERQTLKELAEKRLGGDFDAKNRDKCIRYFLYRGYDLYDIKDVIRELEDEYEI